MNRKRVPVDGHVLRQKALSLYKEFQKKEGTEEEISLLQQAGNGCINLGTGFISKNFKIIGDAASADEKAAATFPAEFKKKLTRRENRS